MSKDPFSDLGDIFRDDVIEAIVSSVIERVRENASFVDEELWEVYRDLPAQLTDWLGEEGHEEPVVPDTGVRYLPLSKTYLTRKRKMFEKRGKSLGGKQAFYSYTGWLYRRMWSFGLSKEDVKAFVKVQASLDGSHWFNVSQRNYRSLKTRLKSRMKKLENITSDLKYRVTTDKKAFDKILRDKLGPVNFKKLQYNDVWRPFLTPAIRYFNKKFVSGKLTEILGEL